MRCVELCRQKYEKFINSFFGKLIRISKPIIKTAEASNDKIPNNFLGINIIYLYDPFDKSILKKFIHINYGLIKKGSFIFYINDLNRKIFFAEFGDKIISFIRNYFYELSVFFIKDDKN